MESVAGSVRTTDVVRYKSAGHCLVIGDSDAVLATCAKLDVPRWTACVLGQERSPEKLLGENGECILQAHTLVLSGHLGAYTARLLGADNERDAAEMAGETRGVFDTVLDLQRTPSIQVETLPFGYFAPQTDALCDQAIEALSDLAGEFDKPRYFRYEASLCAHSASRQTGCTRCLQACDTGAIASIVDSVEVDPYLCQGCGQCATVCPTGAMRYAWPDPVDSAASLRTSLLQRDDRPQLLVYQRDASDFVSAKLDHLAPTVHANCMPVAVEEVGSFGPDLWWSALAWGASRVLLVMDANQGHGGPAIAMELETAAALLSSLGLPETCIRAGALDDCVAALRGGAPDAQWDRGRFGAMSDKRVMIRLALDHLHSAMRAETQVVDLPSHAPFGRVSASDACTLCMSCVSVCPANALLDGSGVPALRFIENNCVQCSLCESACPENAISREQRYLFDSSAARETRELRAEEPFLCVECAKPFAVRSVIEKMQAKLADHWMFSDDKAKRRLMMCEDCRVKDQF
ncbi:MAG: 4Fe-4S binding protein [Pseudomonadota bacterium]